MKTKTFVGRSRELEGLHKALRRSSQQRALLVTGSRGMGKSSLLARYWEDLRSSGAPALWINLSRLPDLREASEVPTALVEALDGSTSSLQGQVATFAQAFGRAIFSAEKEQLAENEDLSKEQLLSRLWTEEFLQIFPLDKTTSGKPLVYVVIDDLDKVRPNVLDLLQHGYVKKWQDAGVIDSFRFLVTSSSWPLPDNATRFVESAAGEDPLLLKMEPLTEAECAELARKRGVSNLSSSDLFAKTKGIPSNVEDELEMQSATRTPFPKETKSGSLPSGLTDQQTQWLSRASCLPDLSMEGLTLFYDGKEAAQAFNWLRYSSKLTKPMPNRSLSLDAGTRQAALDWFRQRDPNGAQAAISRAQQFSDFQARVPVEDERRMLLRLSHFLFFDQEALEAIVGETAKEYMQFVKRKPEWFIETANNYQMLPEYRDLCQRFRKLMGKDSVEEEIRQKIKTCWERKKKRHSTRKDQLLAEESKYRGELSSVDSEFKSLASARENLVAPQGKAGRKRKRQLTIGTSKGFLILGVLVLGLSLGMRDLFSVYHTAAGIFLTLAGFFWPMVSTEETGPQAQPVNDQFAVETQQRVMQFRLNGLETRKSKIRESLAVVYRETRNLEDLLEEPYLLEN